MSKKDLEIQYLREALDYQQERQLTARLTAEAIEARSTNAAEMLCTLRTRRPEIADKIGAILKTLGAHRWAPTSPSSKEPIV